MRNHPSAVTRLSLVLSILGVMIISCGGRRPELVDPGVGVVEIVALAEQSHVNMTIRLENRSELPLAIDQLNLSMTIDDIPLESRIDRTPARVATLSSELISVQIEFNAPLIEALDRLTTGGSRRLPITMTGELITDKGKHLTIDESSWINATPGKPGYFR